MINIFIPGNKMSSGLGPNEIIAVIFGLLFLIGVVLCITSSILFIRNKRCLGNLTTEVSH